MCSGTNYGFYREQLSLAVGGDAALGGAGRPGVCIGWRCRLVATTRAALRLFWSSLYPASSGIPRPRLLKVFRYLTLTIAEGASWGSLTGVSVTVVAIFGDLWRCPEPGEAGQGVHELSRRRRRPIKGGAAEGFGFCRQRCFGESLAPARRMSPPPARSPCPQ